ncbi:hypothetical protein MZD67_10685, partial [Escherichia coli]|nr:hypothetical protein [Escherichia coli]MCK2283198.1 hypothetical protein [Escherichia coli]
FTSNECFINCTFRCQIMSNIWGAVQAASHQASCANVGCDVNALSDLQDLTYQRVKIVDTDKTRQRRIGHLVQMLDAA